MANLLECLEEMEDPRRGAGRRHSLAAILKLILSGLLVGKTSLNEIVRWGRGQPRKTQESLGFRRTPPCAATISNLLRQLAPEALGAMLNRWLAGLGVEAGEHLAMDGKRVRGSGSGQNQQLHLLSLFCTRSGLVMKDTAVQAGENEITAALRLLEQTTLQGKIVTGDAIFSQKKCVG